MNINSSDHREVGKQFDLFYFDDHGPGFPFWLPNGLKIKQQLLKLWRDLHLQNGYVEIETPVMLDKKLWEISGHMDYFKENMYPSSVDKRDFIIKPMSCPGGMLLFNSKKRSHKELPMRMCELGHVHRNENSGSLHGLLRVRAFTQDDAHIFCSQDQLVEEVKKILDLIKIIMNKCGFSEFKFELSVRGDTKQKKYLGDNKDWAIAEEALIEGARAKGHDPKVVSGEAKFYGPSLDLLIKDRNGRFWQCSTIQLDFNLPRRFDIHYFDKNGERKIPYVLHRAIFGSLERFIGILLENYGMDLPYWLMPEQIRIIQIDKKSSEYVEQIRSALHTRGHRISVEVVEDNLSNNIKEAQAMRIPIVLIIGEKEVQTQSLSYRDRNAVKKSNISLNEFLALVQDFK